MELKFKEDLQNLLTVKKTIEETLFTHRDALDKIRNFKNVKIDDVIEFADNLTLTAHAPMEWKVGFPLIKSHLPAPQPEEMRFGYLQKYFSNNQVHTIENEINLTTTSSSNVLNKIRMPVSLQVLKNSAMMIDSDRSNEKVTEEEDDDDEKPEPKRNRTLDISFNVSDSEESDND
jgi:hypothetical protein